MERELFGGSASRGTDDDRRAAPASFGISTWMVAAAALVVGILIGFASGFSAGQRADRAMTPAGDEPAPVATSDDREPAASGRDFTEGSVGEPVRIDPPPIVEAPATPAKESAPAPPPAAAPRPRQADRPAVERPAGSRARTEAPAAAERPRTTRPAPAPAPPAASGPGSLQVLSRPAGADVVLDGRVIGRTPLVVSDVRSGSHEVRIQLGGFRPWATTVNVTAGNRTRVAASLEE